MKKLSAFAVAAAVMAACANPLPERVEGLAREVMDWRNAGPGGGGWIQSIRWSKHSPDRLFVGCDVGGFYVSGNAGRSYETRNRGLSHMFVETIAEHPANPDILLLGSPGGIFKTSDRGRTWHPIRRGLPPFAEYSHTVQISKFTFAPGNPDTVYAAVGQPRTLKGGCGQLWRSDDCGESWRQVVKSGLPSDAALFDISIDPSDPRNILVSSDCGVWLSGDCGATWKLSSYGLPSHLRTRRLARCAAQPRTVYVTLRQKGGEKPWSAGVWRSDDGGRTWRDVSGNLRKLSGKPGHDDNLCTWTDGIEVDHSNPDIVWTLGASWWYAGVFKSTDGGRTWSNAFSSAAPGWIDFWGHSGTCFSMSPTDSRRLAFGTPGAVFVTEDGGSTWHQRYSQDRTDGRLAGTGMEVTCLHTIVPSRHAAGRVYLGYFDIGLLVTEDGGRTFTRAMSGVPKNLSNSCFALAEAPDDPQTLWAAFGSWGGKEPGCVARSDDGARTWQVCTNTASGWRGSRSADLIVTGRKGAYRLMSAGRDGLMISRDGGSTWNLADKDFPLAARVRRVARAGDMLVAAVKGSVDKPDSIYGFSSVAGWRRLFPEGMEIGDIRCVSAQGRRILVTARSRWLAERRKMRPGGVWLSVDAGSTWKKVFSDRFCGAALVAHGELFVSLNDNPYHDRSTGGGVIRSRDDGASWSVLDGPALQNWNATALAVDPFDPRALWVGTGGNSVFIGRLQ